MKLLPHIAIALLALPLLAADAPPVTLLQPIRYERTGGIAGTHDIIEISKEGIVTVDGKLLGKGKGKLTAEKMTSLAALFGDWQTLPHNFPAPPGAADGFDIKIRYGAVEVAVNDANGAIPPNFRDAQKAIEGVAHDMTGK